MPFSGAPAPGLCILWRDLSHRNPKHLADIQQIAGQSVQAPDIVYRGMVTVGNEPEGIPGLDRVFNIRPGCICRDD